MLKFQNGEWIFVRPGLCFIDDPAPITADHPEVKAIVEAAVEESVKGLKSKNEELLGKIAKGNETAKTLKATLDELGGDDGIKALKAMQEAIDKDEDLKLFTSGNRKEYDERIIGRLREDLGGQLKARDKIIGEKDAALKSKDRQLSKVVIEGQIRDSAVKSKMRQSAIPDAIRRGLELFSLDDDGKAVARVGETLVNGKDGDPLTIDEWVPSMREKEAPHWWDTPSGTNSDPNRRSAVPPEGGTVDIRDQHALNSNIEGLASGKVKVSNPST